MAEKEPFVPFFFRGANNTSGYGDIIYYAMTPKHPNLHGASFFEYYATGSRRIASDPDTVLWEISNYADEMADDQIEAIHNVRILSTVEKTALLKKDLIGDTQIIKTLRSQDIYTDDRTFENGISYWTFAETPAVLPNLLNDPIPEPGQAESGRAESGRAKRARRGGTRTRYKSSKSRSKSRAKASTRKLRRKLRRKRYSYDKK